MGNYPMGKRRKKDMRKPPRKKLPKTMLYYRKRYQQIRSSHFPTWSSASAKATGWVNRGYDILIVSWTRISKVGGHGYAYALYVRETAKKKAYVKRMEKFFKHKYTERERWSL